jgi:hypothetical protein
MKNFRTFKKYRIFDDQKKSQSGAKSPKISLGPPRYSIFALEDQAKFSVSLRHSAVVILYF